MPTNLERIMAGLLSFSAALLLTSSPSRAGAVVELRLGTLPGFQSAPSQSNGTWNGGERVLVEFWFTADESFSIRGAQIDYRHSSPGFSLGEDIDSVNQFLDGIPNFWFDYTTAASSLFTYPVDGTRPEEFPWAGDYADFSNLLAGDDLAPFPPSSVASRSTHSANWLIKVVAGIPRRLGGMPTVLPTTPGTYHLDLLSPDPADANNGAYIAFGFGSAVIGDHAVTLWSTATVDPTVDDFIDYAVGAGPMQFVVVPEPVTLILLGLGVVVAQVRRGIRRLA